MFFIVCVTCDYMHMDNKVANRMLIDDGYINNIDILEEVLVNSHSSFQDKELDLASNLTVFRLHGIFFSWLSRGLVVLLSF